VILIKGFVCLAQIDGQSLLFGPSDIHGEQIGNLQGNGLLAFESVEQAAAALRLLEARTEPKFDRVLARSISLKIAETEEDLKMFAKSKSLIVIACSNEQDWRRNVYLLGRKIPGMPAQMDYGAYLTLNGIKLFLDLEKAHEAFRQYRRQAQAPARIAELSLMHAELPR
jgi:hypothetical protein